MIYEGIGADEDGKMNETGIAFVSMQLAFVLFAFGVSVSDLSAEKTFVKGGLAAISPRFSMSPSNWNSVNDKQEFPVADEVEPTSDDAMALESKGDPSFMEEVIQEGGDIRTRLFEFFALTGPKDDTSKKTELELTNEGSCGSFGI